MGSTQRSPCRDPPGTLARPGAAAWAPAPAGKAQPGAVCGISNSGTAASPQPLQDLLPTATSPWTPWDLFPTAATPQTPQDLLPTQGSGLWSWGDMAMAAGANKPVGTPWALKSVAERHLSSGQGRTQVPTWFKASLGAEAHSKAGRRLAGGRPWGVS